MSLLKALPIFALVGTAIVVAGKAAIDLMEDENDYKSNEKNPTQVIEKIKDIQNELARLHDLKMLNDKRESTGQLRKTEITVGGVEINTAISTLEEEIARLTKKLNKMKSNNNRKRRD